MFITPIVLIMAVQTKARGKLRLSVSVGTPTSSTAYQDAWMAKSRWLLYGVRT